MKARAFLEKATDLARAADDIYQKTNHCYAKLAICRDVPPYFLPKIEEWVKVGQELRKLIEDAAKILGREPPFWTSSDELQGIILSFAQLLEQREPKILWKHQIMEGGDVWVAGVMFPRKSFTTVVFWLPASNEIIGGNEPSAQGRVFSADLTLDERLAIEEVLKE